MNINENKYVIHHDSGNLSGPVDKAVCKYKFQPSILLIKSKLENQKLSSCQPISGADPETLKRGALYVGHHGWLTKKILVFRWSKKAKIALEIKAFGETVLSVFSNFLHFYI